MKTLAAALVLLAAAACAAPPTAPVEGPPPDPRVLAFHDLRDLVGGEEGGPPPVFTSGEAAGLWAHRTLDASCWTEGIPETEWRAGTLVVRAVPAAQERLAAALALLREARR